MSQGLILGLSLSIMFNVLVILILIGTGIGKDVFNRWIWKLKHRSGKYAYTLMATKSGNIKEVFASVNKGKFVWNDESYVRNPRMTRNYRGIPANFHREGTPNCIDPWGEDLADWAISTGELDDVMMANQEFDTRAFLQKWATIIIIGLLVLVASSLISIYFGYSVFETLRDVPATASQLVNAN